MNQKKYKIYKHTSPSNKVYIGQTCEENVEERWLNNGRGYLGKNKDGSYRQPYMAKAINKYPWNQWKHEIIDYADTQKEADILEIKYIKEYKSNNSLFGYNLTAGGYGHLGQPRSQETKDKISKTLKEKYKDPEYRKKISEAHKGIPIKDKTKESLRKANTGRKCTEETKQKLHKVHSKGVLQYSISGKLIATYDTCEEAALAIGKNRKTIGDCCNGRNKTCGGFIFLYKNSKETIKDRINKLSPNSKPQNRKVLQYSASGEFIKEYKSLKDASINTNYSYSGISSCCTGQRKTLGGYIFIYKEDKPNIKKRIVLA